MTTLSIRGIDVSLDELKADVESAKKKGLSNLWAFTPETVQALIDNIEQKDILLKATHSVLKECNKGIYVKNAMSIEVNHDSYGGDGYSLMNDIADLLDIAD